MRKKSINISKICFFLMALLLMATACENKDNKTDKYSKYNETTQQLISLVESDTRLKSLLTEAIEKGILINPDKSTNPAQSLEEYYDFIDYSQTAMP